MINKQSLLLLLGFFFSLKALAVPYPASNDTLNVFYKKVDSIYVELYHQHQESDREAIKMSIAAIDALVAPLEEKHPLICGMVQLHQAYYAGDANGSAPYLKKGLGNLSGADVEFVRNYAGSFLWLIEGFYLENRQAEWAPADSLFRNVINSGNEGTDPGLAISHAAGRALMEKNYAVAEALAKYDQYYLQQPESTADRIQLVYLKWVQEKIKLDQWMQIPYDERSLTRYHFNPGQVIPEFLNSEQPDHSALRK